MNRAELVKRQLNSASPLQMAQALKDLDLYDKKEALQVIDEVYEKFKNGDAQVENLAKPVCMSVADSLLESCKPMKALRKKGLTASRIYTECEGFRYDKPIVHFHEPDAYEEYKNARDEIGYDSTFSTSHTRSSKEINTMASQKSPYRNSGMHDYTGNRNLLYKPDNDIRRYKKEHYNGKNTAVDEYTGEALTKGTDSNTDHVIPLARVHAQVANNIALNSADVKNIANQQANFRETNSRLNKSKNDNINEDVDGANEVMLRASREAQGAINESINTAVIDTFMGRGAVDTRMCSDDFKQVEAKTAESIKSEEEKLGRELTSKEKKDIKDGLFNEKVQEVKNKFDKDCEEALKAEMKNNPDMNKKQRERFKKDYKEKVKAEMQKQKQLEAFKNVGGAAMKQTGEMALGNLIMYMLKPIYYEMKDSIKFGLKEGVGAKTLSEAIKKRFSRVKNHIMQHAGEFFRGSFKDMLKQFVSMFIEGIINCFVGALKLIFKAIKEGVKIFVKACKVIWSNDPNLTERQKGDAILKVIGGGLVALTGIGIEFLFEHPALKPFVAWMGDFKPVFASLISGILSALFMNVLDKIDIFAVKSEKRRMAIEAIFAQRAKELEAATQAMDVTAIEVMNKQEMAFDQINTAIHQSLKDDNMECLSKKVTEMAAFFRIELPYSNADEFAKAYDANDEIVLGTI